MKLLPLEEVAESEDLSSTARQKAAVRATPVVNSKYLHVWKRVRAKLKSQYTVKKLKVELNLYGTNKSPSPKGVDDPFATFQLAASKSKSVSPYIASDSRLSLPWYILHPDHNPRRRWDLSMSLVLLYTATIMPYRIAFETESSEVWTAVEYTVMALFFVDLCLNFLTAYYRQDGELVTSVPYIARHYAAGWLIIDLIACVPFNLIGSNGDMTQSSGSGYSNMLKLVRVPQLYRLLRLSRLLKALKSSEGCFSRLQDRFSLKHSFIRLFSFFLSMLTGVHLIACLWCFLPSLEANPTQSWLFRHNLQDSDSLSVYIAACYWAIATLTTVGYGDISAHTLLERVVAVGWMVFGIFFFSFTIGSLTAMVTHTDSNEAILTQKIAIVDEFAKYAHLNTDLRGRLKHALHYSSSRTGFSWTERRAIFTELPKDLKYEVAMIMHQGAASRLQFFENRPKEFISEIVPFLVPTFIDIEKYVYRIGEHASEVYFLVQGRCTVSTVIKGENVQLRVIPSGSHFGEMEVIESTPRGHDVKAVQHSHLLTMSRPLLREVEQEFPRVYSELVLIGKTRKELLEKLITEYSNANTLQRKETLQRTKTSELVDLKVTGKVEKSDKKSELSVEVKLTMDRLDGIGTKMSGVKGLLRRQIEHLKRVVEDRGQEGV